MQRIGSGLNRGRYECLANELMKEKFERVKKERRNQ